MAQTFSNELDGMLNATPAEFADGAVVGGRLRRYRATIDLAAQASGDTIVIARAPYGSVFAFGLLNGSVSLSTATVAIGTSAAAGKYRAAAVHTATTPTLFGLYSAADDAALTEDEEILLTVGAAALPASGTLVVDLFFSGK